MAGYEKFHGDVVGMLRRYFEFANWFFCSPFMACMRDMAGSFKPKLLPFSVFCPGFGENKNGKKTFFVKPLKKMILAKPKTLTPLFLQFRG